MTAFIRAFRTGLTATGLILVAAIGGLGEARAQTGRGIIVSNACNRPVQVMVYHSVGLGYSYARGWYLIGASETAGVLLRSNGVLIRQADNVPFGYYAETTDGGTVRRWQGKGPVVTFQGKVYRTTDIGSSVNTDGNLVIRLTCP